MVKGNIVADKEDKGVLPTGGTPDMSATSAGNNAMEYEDGGMVEDPAQDTGNAMPEQADPFGLITQALNHGRKKFNVLNLFRSTPERQPSPQAKAVDEAVGAEMGQPQDRTTEYDAMMRNRVMKDMDVGGQMNYGDTTITKDQPETMYLEGGGMIPDGSETAPSEGQEQGMTPSGGSDQQAVMAYLSGQGGVPAEVAMAVERSVDPQGTMDPSERKLRALASAPDPDKAFGLMQHYRSKFNGYAAFAQAAMQGAGGRPPNGMAAAEALTKAYENVPDGNALQFQPVPGGMKVAMRKIIPSKPAPSGGEKPPSETPPGPPVKHFEDGGMIEEEVNFDYETAGAKPWAGDPTAIADQEYAAQGGPIQQALGGRTPHEALREFVISIPELLGWVKKDGQFDSVIDKGVEATMPKGQPGQAMAAGAPAPMEGIPFEGPQQMAPGAPGTFKPPAMPKEPPSQFTDEPTHVAANWPTPKLQEIVQEAAEKGTLRDVLHEIDLAFPFVGQSQQKSLARAQAIQEWQKNQSGITREQIRGEFAGARNQTTNDTRLQQTGMTVEGGLERARIQARSMGERAAALGKSREEIERLRQTGQWERMVQQETQKAYRTLTLADPKSARNPERMEQNLQGRPSIPGQAPSAQQAPAQAAPQQQAPQMTQAPPLPPAALSALKEGQVTKFKNGQSWTLKGGQPVQVQ